MLVWSTSNHYSEKLTNFEQTTLYCIYMIDENIADQMCITTVRWEISQLCENRDCTCVIITECIILILRMGTYPRIIYPNDINI